MQLKLYQIQKNRLLADQCKQVKNYGLVLRVYPSAEQSEVINKTVGCSLLVYNMYLAARKEYSFLKEVDK
jgi:putative transposase